MVNDPLLIDVKRGRDRGRGRRAVKNDTTCLRPPRKTHSPQSAPSVRQRLEISLIRYPSVCREINLRPRDPPRRIVTAKPDPFLTQPTNGTVVVRGPIRTHDPVPRHPRPEPPEHGADVAPRADSHDRGEIAVGRHTTTRYAIDEVQNSPGVLGRCPSIGNLGSSQVSGNALPRVGSASEITALCHEQILP
jgi:hypothetical protein